MTRCKARLMTWSKERYREHKGTIETKLAHIKSLQEINLGYHNEKLKQLQKEVDLMLEVDDLKWKQRTK